MNVVCLRQVYNQCQILEKLMGSQQTVKTNKADNETQFKILLINPLLKLQRNLYYQVIMLDITKGGCVLAYVTLGFISNSATQIFVWRDIVR